ncbi:alpha-(1,3)-fucosyltransferase C-like [Zerene cesonia]|uniref:alpha-(1,3)-fucosyltransferase C-like n=1 Tax=Zerene cesonia TaxID=33412 RepID=UPI0018E5661A|nr:alpha-(1,3)-fucosyltransferase C-like [Zerene cesonia]
MGAGQQGFIDRKCPNTKCFVTENRTYLRDYTNFDVIAFAGPEVVNMGLYDLPKRRSSHQKFTFASIESADNYPICSDALNNFFNWTWTYKLDSEAKWGYIVVRDSENRIVGPKQDMHWIKLPNMAPVSEDVKGILRNKSKAAAWFVSNCFSKSGRENFVKKLSIELIKYDLDIDIYGNCGILECSRDEEEKCNKLIETDYYFYLSFENSFSEDYVTEKLLYPLKHYAVPIVYGGANYTRFMPDGIYLNALELGTKKLAKKMKELIENPEKYAEYFKWKNHYSYYRRSESVETDDYCRFCSMLYEDDLVKTTSVYKNFKEWWTPPNTC